MPSLLEPNLYCWPWEPPVGDLMTYGWWIFKDKTKLWPRIKTHASGRFPKRSKSWNTKKVILKCLYRKIAMRLQESTDAPELCLWGTTSCARFRNRWFFHNPMLVGLKQRNEPPKISWIRSSCRKHDKSIFSRSGNATEAEGKAKVHCF